MTMMIKTTLERELYDALKALNTTVDAWFGDVNLPFQFQPVVGQANKAIDKADGKKMGKIEMIKHARQVSGLGLRDAKDLVELILQNAPDQMTTTTYDQYGYAITRTVPLRP